MTSAPNLQTNFGCFPKGQHSQVMNNKYGTICEILQKLQFQVNFYRAEIIITLEEINNPFSPLMRHVSNGSIFGSQKRQMLMTTKA
jgi:hypothetical protein